jgi:ribose-phosphate pyrophosphokinase
MSHRVRLHGFADTALFARRLAGAARLPLAAVRVHRFPDGETLVRAAVPPGRHAFVVRSVIVDDVASSGATIAATARALRRQGVRTVDAVVAHAIFAPGAERRIRAAGVRRLVSCDTVPHPTNAIRVAPLMAAALPRSA